MPGDSGSQTVFFSEMLSFAQPWWLLLLAPFVAAIWMRRRRSPRGLALPTAASTGGARTFRIRLRLVLPWLTATAICLMICAMARPQRVWQEEKITRKGIDILLAIDLSLSMLSRDFEPNRLVVAKEVAKSFVDRRPNDRIGVVAFAGEAFTHCPLTTDQHIVKTQIDQLETGLLNDGTAIGVGLAIAVNRLQQAAEGSKIIILMTDGKERESYIPAIQAAEMAREKGVKVYTVGIGSEGMVLMPTDTLSGGKYFYDYVRSDFDGELLDRIAQITEGRYFRAKTADDLSGIYKNIDRLEKTTATTQIIRHTADLAYALLGVAALLLMGVAAMYWGPLRGIDDTIL